MFMKILIGGMFFAFISTIVGIFVSEIIFKDPTQKFKIKIVLNFFIAGLLVHFTCELLNFNKTYCKHVHSDNKI